MSEEIATESVTAIDTVKKSTTINLDEGMNWIKVVRTAKKAETDPVATTVVWQFGLDSWTQKELLEYATRSLVIDAQRLWRKGDISDEQALTKEIMSPERKTKKKAVNVDSVKAYLATLTPEERNELINTA